MEGYGKFILNKCIYEGKYKGGTRTGIGIFKDESGNTVK